ncbi:MAG TPA: thiamine pyrophosphate-dependent enzyme [Micropepsaceae bacterium]|nr:thiamine pyrophosphate-dependent enzyme [Micropepsaceae bacterium]
MSREKDVPNVKRRRFLKGAGLAGAAAIAAPLNAVAQTGAPAPANNPVPLPNKAAETQVPPELEVLTEGKSGSDFMVDCIKSLGFEYMAANPASSFRGLHESLINYGGNKDPEFLTCSHEEISVAMGHGYYKIEGKPLCVFAHGTVGLHHATMALYNAWCDRVPVYVVIGNIMDVQLRRPGIEWNHSAQDPAAVARDFLKWDDNPASLQHFAESAVRAYKIAMTPPTLPVLLVADGALQEDPIPAGMDLRIPKLPRISAPQGDAGAVAETARLLATAENPVLIADHYARTAQGGKLLVELAETLHCPVIDTSGRLNLPSRHPLNQSSRARAHLSQADVVLGLEMTDYWGTINSYRDQIHRTSKPITKPGAKLISLGSGDLYTKSNYQDFQRFADVDMAITGDGESTMPMLIEAVKTHVDAGKKSAFETRGKKFAEMHKADFERARTDATYGWDASPVSTGRLCAEVWNQVKDEDWSMASPTASLSYWPQRLWTMDKPYHFIGDGGGMGIGYCASASVGAALANRKHGRFTVAIQCDGDLLMTIGVLWTAAHHKIPLMFVMHNNRGYHQELMHVQRMANRHMRGLDRAHIGTTLRDPYIDYAKIAQGMGIAAIGPISDPKDLGPALTRAKAIVKGGEPVLVDVVTQGR